MTKEDLNRRFGNPERQKPVTPFELLAAAHLIREHCNNNNICIKCIFHDNEAFSCLLFSEIPDEWDLSDVEARAMDWIDKQFPSGRVPYLDTDKYTDKYTDE